MRCYMRHLSSIIEERFSRSKMRLTKMECAAKMSAYFAQAIEKLDDGGYGLPWLLPNQMLMLLASVNLTPVGFVIYFNLISVNSVIIIIKIIMPGGFSSSSKFWVLYRRTMLSYNLQRSYSFSLKS